MPPRPSRRAIREAARKRNAARATSLKITSGLSKEDIAALNAAEGETAQDLSTDPSARELFENMLRLSTLNKGERDDVMEHLREVAEENLKPFFEAEREEVLTDVRFAMETITQQFTEFSEETKREFGQAIERLDVESATQLRDTLTSVNQRGLLNSGILAILAQRVIDDEEFSARQFQEDLEADIQFAGEKEALARKEVGIKEARAFRDIEQEETEAVEVQATQEAGRLELNEILTAIQDGVADIDPATGEFRFKPPEEDPIPPPPSPVDITQEARGLPPPPPRRTIESVEEGPSREIQERVAVTEEGISLQERAARRREERLANAATR